MPSRASTSFLHGHMYQLEKHLDVSMPSRASTSFLRETMHYLLTPATISVNALTG